MFHFIQALLLIDDLIQYRQVVVEWMIDVADYFCLHITTTHAAIAYLDRLQPNEKFSRLEWQILAICCIIIAAKYNECEEHVPSLKRIEEITQQSISNDIFLNYELWALKKMSWKLSGKSFYSLYINKFSSYLNIYFSQHELLLPFFLLN